MKKLISNLKPKVATGDDEISAKILKACNDTIAPILTQIINLGYKTSIFPDRLKSAIIKPIFKTDDPNLITNYRPISILTILSKIFERAAVDQMISFLEKYELINKNQHAYRKFHNTITCLFEVLQKIYTALDNKKIIAIASLDLSKAFDSISHKLLLKKLPGLGFGNHTVDWIDSYLSNRVQKTKFENFISNSAKVESGIPQGSILGPLLFLCYTNDLPKSFENICDVFSYADDTQLLVSADNLDELKTKIGTAMSTAQSWYDKNLMKNNIGKTEVIVFSRNKKEKLELKIRGVKKKIKSKPCIKILGIHIDNKLTFNKQIKKTKKKAMNAARKVHRINKFLPLKERLLLYHALISPLFDYGDVIFGGCNEKESNSLQKVQNFAVKSINGKSKSQSTSESFKKTKLLNLKTRRNIHETVFVHKALTKKSAGTTCKIFKKYVPKIQTRRATKMKLNIPNHKYTKYKKSPLYRCIKAWNDCPENLNMENIKTHKNQLQNYLVSKKYPNL